MKNINYNIKRVLKNELKSISVTNTISCYQIITFIDEKCFRIVEGIIETEKIKNKSFSQTDNLTIKFENENNKNYLLFKKSVIDDNNTKGGGFYAMDFDLQKSYIINNPYTFIKQNPNWKENYIILDYKVYSGDLVYLDETYVPKGIHFDYMEGIHNGNYDLESLHSYLAQNAKVKDLTSIIPIPYYNAEEGMDMTISFVYIPDKEEYNKYHDDCTHLSLLHNLGLTQFSINNED